MQFHIIYFVNVIFSLFLSLMFLCTERKNPIKISKLKTISHCIMLMLVAQIHIEHLKSQQNAKTYLCVLWLRWQNEKKKKLKNELKPKYRISTSIELNANSTNIKTNPLGSSASLLMHIYHIYIYTNVFVSVYKCLLKTVHWLWLSPNNHVVWIVKTYQGFDALGDVLKPASASNNSNQMNVVAAGYSSNSSSILALQQQQHQQQHQHQLNQQQQQQPPAGTGKIITGDLDSSLMSLVDNLNINKTASAKWVNRASKLTIVCACVRKRSQTKPECWSESMLSHPFQFIRCRWLNRVDFDRLKIMFHIRRNRSFDDPLPFIQYHSELTLPYSCSIRVHKIHQKKWFEITQKSI